MWWKRMLKRAKSRKYLDRVFVFFRVPWSREKFVPVTVSLVRNKVKKSVYV